jgi:hypothetical protein
MKFPGGVDANVAGRKQMLSYVDVRKRQTSSSHDYDRKIEEIYSKLERILQQNRVERAVNAAHDEKTIAGCVGDLGDSLTEYQVIKHKFPVG